MNTTSRHNVNGYECGAIDEQGLIGRTNRLLINRFWPGGRATLAQVWMWDEFESIIGFHTYH